MALPAIPVQDDHISRLQTEQVADNSTEGTENKQVRV